MAEGQEPTAAAVTDLPATTEAANVETFNRAYVESLRQEAAKYRTQAKAVEEAQAKAEEERLKNEKKFQELAQLKEAEANSLRPYKERLDAILATLADSNKKRLDQLPDNMKALVPEYDDPARLATWLETNWQVLTGKPTYVPGLNGGAGNGQPRAPQITLSDDELMVAQKMGLSPEVYLKAKTAKAKV